MSYRLEFVSEVADGTIRMPAEMAARLALRGIRAVRVVVTSVGEDNALLAARGIDADTVDRVAAVQRFDRDVASVVLLGEGAAAGTELADRLAGLAGASTEGHGPAAGAGA